MYVLMLRCLMLAVAGALKDLESEKRRTKELQEQLDKANLKIRQIEGSHLYLKPLLQTIHQNLKIVKQSQAGLVSEKEAMIAYGESLKAQGQGLQEKVAQVPIQLQIDVFYSYSI